MKILRHMVLIGILFFPFVVKGVVFLDVDEINFDSRKGIRIATFDTEAQKFLHLTYVQSTIPIIKTEEKSLHEQEITLLNLPFLPEGLALFSNGDLKIESWAVPPYIIRTFGNLQPAEHIMPHMREMGGKKILFSTFEAKSGLWICEHLKSFTDNSTKPHFKADVLSEDLQSQETKTFRGLGEIERGVLGELATEMTMMTCGYQKLPSQNRNGQGFDGVYIRVEEGEEPIKSEKFLFLTESKCRQESISAENYLIKTLNESALCTQINREDLPQDTKKVIECFIADSPGNIYKLVHRLKINGQFQCAGAFFDIHAYRWAQLISDSFSLIPKSDQVSLFGYLYQKLQLSPIMALQYALESYNLSSGEGISLLALHALQDDRREHILSHFSDASIFPLTEQSFVLSSPLTGVSAGSVTIKASRSEAPSTPDLTDLFGQLSLTTPSPSPIVTLPKKNPPVRRLPFSLSPSTPSTNRALSPEVSSIVSSSFGKYKPDKLQYFASILNGKEGIGGSKGIGRIIMHRFYSDKKSPTSPELSDKPFKNLLIGGTPKKGKKIWETYTQNFTELCKEANIPEQKFLAKWREKYPDTSSASALAATPSPSYASYPSSSSGAAIFPGSPLQSGSFSSPSPGSSSFGLSTPISSSSYQSAVSTSPFSTPSKVSTPLSSSSAAISPGSPLQSGSFSSPSHGSSPLRFSAPPSSSSYQNAIPPTSFTPNYVGALSFPSSAAISPGSPLQSGSFSSPSLGSSSFGLSTPISSSSYQSAVSTSPFSTPSKVSTPLSSSSTVISPGSPLQSFDFSSPSHGSSPLRFSAPPSSSSYQNAIPPTSSTPNYVGAPSFPSSAAISPGSPLQSVSSSSSSYGSSTSGSSALAFSSPSYQRTVPTPTSPFPLPKPQE